MYLQQTFFGPEGVFVASSVPPHPLQQAHRQCLSCQKKKSSKTNKSTAPTTEKRSSDSCTDRKRRVFYVPVVSEPLKVNMPAKMKLDHKKDKCSKTEERSDLMQYGQKEREGERREEERREEVGERVKRHQSSQQPWVSSLSDLSSHPVVEEEWYKLEPQEDYGHTYSLGRASPSSCSLMEVSPVTTPTREAVTGARKLTFPAAAGATKVHCAKHQTSSLRGCRSTSPKSSFSDFSFQVEETRLPPEGSEMMHTVKPRTREVPTVCKSNLRVRTQPVPVPLLRPRSAVEVTLTPLSPEKEIIDLLSPVRSSSAAELTGSEVNLSDYPPSPYELNLTVTSPSSSCGVNSPLALATCSPSPSACRSSWASNGSSSAGKFTLSPPHNQYYYHHHHRKPITTTSVATSTVSDAAEDGVGGQRRVEDQMAKVKKSAMKNPRNSSGIGMPLSPPREKKKFGSSSSGRKKNHQVSPISPYAVSVINSPEPRTRTNHSHRVRFQTDMPLPPSKTKLASGDYDLLENVSSPSSSNSHSNPSSKSHSSSSHHFRSNSHSKSVASSPIQSYPQSSKTDHNVLCTSPSCYCSGLSHYAMPSSAPAFFDAGSSFIYPPQSSRRSSSINHTHHHQQHYHQVRPRGARKLSPVHYCLSPQRVIHPSASQLSFLSSLSAHSNGSSALGGRWVWSSGSEVWLDTTDGKVGVAKSRHHHRHRSHHQYHHPQQCHFSHYQLPSSIPSTRSNHFLQLLQTLG